MRRSAAPAIAIVVALGVVGCGGSSSKSAATPTTVQTTTVQPTTTVAAPVPEGYTAFTSQTDHFTVATPSAWRQIDPSSPDATQRAQDLARDNPAFRSVLGSGDLSALGMKYFAADTASTNNVNVIVKPAAGAHDSDLPGVVDALKSQYATIGGTVTGTRTVRLAGHDALQVSLELKVNPGTGAPSTLHEVQDVVAANDRVYILTLTGSGPELDKVAETLQVS